MKGGSFWRRRGGAKIVRAALFALALIVGAVTAALISRDSGDRADHDAARPDPFYAAADPLPAGRSGAILRSARLADPPAGTLAFKLLYRSRSYTGKPTALSAVLIVPARPAPSNGRNVVAATHGTVGVASRCAPSGDPASLTAVPGLAQFMRGGAAVVVPDFEGLGTRGPPHPYLVGDAAAWATLDAVRAVALFRPAGASRRFVVWGPGQGGHAALFAGQRAARYAPELELAGVAAAAPLSDLQRILELSRGETAGRIMAAYTLAAWSRSYPQVRLGDIVSPAGRRIVEQVASACIPLDTGPIPSAVGQAADALSYIEKEPFRAASLRTLLARNTPGSANLPAPVFITQGTRDRLVPPDLTRRFVRRLCSRGVRVRYRAYRKVAHRDAAPKTASDVASWIAERFAGAPARTSCR